MDQVFLQQNLPAPNLIKIDIEGGEIAMLEGGRKLLAQARPLLLVELHGTNSGVDRVLSELNYVRYVLGRDGSVLSASWYAFVIAAPAEQPEKCRAAHDLALRAHLDR